MKRKVIIAFFIGFILLGTCGLTSCRIFDLVDPPLDPFFDEQHPLIDTNGFTDYVPWWITNAVSTNNINGGTTNVVE